MKNKIIALVLIVLSLSAFGFDIPSRPNRLMNDYIGLLTSDQIQALETKLVDFDNKTSIQITIVILDDLDGEDKQNVATEIGKEWGVGQKGIDNGIVFLIVKYSKSAKEKLYEQRNGDWFIAPGYGLEPYITDYHAKSIGESQFIPFAKEDKYYEGIDATINAIIENLGEIGWQQREELEAKKKAEHDEAMRKLGNGFLMFIISAAVLGLLIFLVIKIRKSIRKAQEIKQRRASLKKTFYGAKTEFDSLLSRIPNNSSSYPLWAIDKHYELMRNIERASKVPAKSVIEEFPVIIESNMVRASQILSILTSCVQGLAESIAELEEIPNEIKKYRDAAPVKLLAAEAKFQKFATSIQVVKEKGFKLALYEKELEEFKVSLSKTKEKTGTEEDQSKDVFLESIGINEGIEGTMQLMNEYLENRETTSKIIASIDTEITNLPTKKEVAQNILDQLKSGNPKDNWEDMEKAFGSVTALFGLCQAKRDEAGKRNGMDVQDFTTAKSLADESNEKIQKILNIFHAIFDRKEEIENARANYDSFLESAETAISLAEATCKDTDVKESSKKKMLEAQAKLKEAKTASSASLINWLRIVSLLVSAKDFADEANTMAKNDIEKAENARTLAAAAIAAAAAAALAKKKADDEPTKTYYHSSPSPSDNGGGFGGFGGGSFGGGGAGGSW